MNLTEELNNAFKENSDKPHRTAEDQAQALLGEFPLCFLTGTRAYGPVTSKSDWDVACPIWLETSIRARVCAFPISMEQAVNIDYPGRCTKHTALDGVKLNLVFLVPIEYVCWRYATDLMRLLPGSQDHRVRRYAEFEALRALVKSRIADTPWMNQIKGVEHLFLGKPLTTPDLYDTLVE